MTEGRRRNEKEILDILSSWEEDPQRMFSWRSTAFRRLVLLLEDMALHPTGSPGRKETSQLRAVELLQKQLVAMEEIRWQVPVTCPKCNHRFQVGEDTAATTAGSETPD